MTNLNHLTITSTKSLFTTKKLTPVELVEHYQKRISQIDPQIHSFLSLNPKAKEEAENADLSRPLGGIPIAVKDNFLTTGISTTASSNVLKDYIPQYDATVVTRLKQAGAIIIGKTNMDAWAHGSSTETSDFGATLNPHDTGHLPGGSSGGSAAAVAADLCVAAIGSETAGSIRQPAAWCGVTGFKPTYGRVSRYGVIAMASSTDSPGPLAKNTDDCEIITRVLAGKDPYDATSSSKEYATFDIRKGIKGKKIGLPKEYILQQMRPEVKNLIKKAADTFANLGASVEEISLIDPHYSIGVYTIVQRSEVSSNLARFDGIRYGQSRDSFGQEAKRRIMLGTYALSSGYYDQYYIKAQKVRTLIINDFAAAYKKYDLIIGPTSPGPALAVGASLNQPMFGEMEDILVEPSSIAGLTGISIPCGFVDALPIGLQIIGPQYGEAAVLQAAHAFQQVTNYHNQQPPL